MWLLFILIKSDVMIGSLCGAAEANRLITMMGTYHDTTSFVGDRLLIAKATYGDTCLCWYGVKSKCSSFTPYYVMQIGDTRGDISFHLSQDTHS